MDSSTDPQTGLISLVCIRDLTDSRLNVVACAGESRTVDATRAAQLVATGCFATVPQAAPPPGNPQEVVASPGVSPASPEKPTSKRASRKSRASRSDDEPSEDPLRAITGGTTFLG